MIGLANRISHHRKEDQEFTSSYLSAVAIYLQ